MRIGSSLVRIRNGAAPSGFVRNVIELLSGSTIGQLVAFLASIVLTRVYGPGEFGILALYLGFISVLLSFVSLRYEVAIPLPAEDSEAASLVRVSTILILIVSSLVALAFYVIGHRLAALLKAEPLSPYLWLIPVTLLVSGLYQVLNYWSIRKKVFRGVAQGRVFQALTQAVTQVGMGLAKIGAVGLLGGYLFGQLAGTWVTYRKARSEQSGHDNDREKASLLQVANKYRQFPLFTTWDGILNNLSLQVPVFILAGTAGSVVVGLYSFGVRVIQAPFALLGQSVAQVFFSDASEANREGLLAVRVLRVYNVLIRIGLSVFAPLMVTAPQVFSLLFGQTWAKSGCYVQILIPWMLLVFVNSPLSMVPIVMKRQDGDVIFQSTLLVVRASAIYGGYLIGGADFAIWAFGAISAIWWLGFNGWIFRLVHIPAVKSVLVFAKPLLTTAAVCGIILIVKAMVRYYSYAGLIDILSTCVGGIFLFYLLVLKAER